MAFTKNPTDQTQIIKRMSLVGSEEQRNSSATKDQRFVNFMPEKIDVPGKENSGKYWLRLRPGMTSVYTTANATPRGLYYWDKDGGHVISVVGNAVYYDSTSLTTITTSTGNVGFTEFLDSTGTRKLIMLDGTKGYVFTAYNVVPTAITDVDFPTPHIPMPVFLDGYLFVAKTDTQDIYNSDLNDPLTWTTGDYISAEMYPDTIKALTKNNNYVIAVGSNSTEYFYDAATASGSPLARHDAAVQQFGSPSPRTVVQTDKEVVLLGSTGDGGRSVFAIDGFKSQDISIPALRYALNAEGTSITSASAFQCRVAGQKLYVLSLTSRIFVYSFETKLWHEWSFVNTPYFSTDSASGYPYVQVNNGTTTLIAKLDDAVALDLSSIITGVIVTAKLDMDSNDRKRMDSLVLIHDAPNGNTDVPLTVQWSNDDYVTWSSGATMQLNATYSALFRLGQFRRRALKFTYTQPYPIRIEGMEIAINKGQT